MTKKEFGQLMAVVQSLFEIKAKDAAGYEVWFELLHDLEYSTAVQAVKKLGLTHHGFLAPAQIREACQDILNPRPSFTEAYKTLNYARQYFGRYRVLEAVEYIKEQNAELHEVVKAIGYKSLCDCNPEFSRGAVERMYKEVVTGGKDQLLLGSHSDDIAKIRMKALPNYGGDD